MSLFITDGAHCTAMRDGQVFATFDSAPAHLNVDVTASQSDIIVTCSLNGLTKSRTVQLRRTEMIFDGPLCEAPPPHATRAERRLARACERQPHSASNIVTEYWPVFLHFEDQR